MEGLIFIIPVLLIFLFFFIQIFLLFKKFFSYIYNNISQISQEVNDNYNSTQSENEDKPRYSFSQTIEKPEEEYVPIRDRDINVTAEENFENNANNKKNSKANIKGEILESENNKDEIIKKYKDAEDRSSLFGAKLRNVNELEKAIILKEILDKPKALRK